MGMTCVQPFPLKQEKNSSTEPDILSVRGQPPSQGKPKCNTVQTRCDTLRGRVKQKSGAPQSQTYPTRRIEKSE